MGSNTFLNLSGEDMYKWATDLFPLNRSLTGKGTLDTLKYLGRLIPKLEIKTIESGTQVFDWTVPDEWNIKEGYIKDSNGNRIVDLKVNNLHVMGYSIPVRGNFTKTELSKHVHTLPEQPSAIPYVTSYYEDAWAFCMSYNQWKELDEGPFEVFIDSEKFKGTLNYGEILIPGVSKQEILFSTYVCHPSMGNNELSGPVVLAKLLREIEKSADRHYSYRAIFIPETIGSLVYLSRNLKNLKENLVAGWVMTCLGDSGNFSYIPSRNGNSYADRITKRILNSEKLVHHKYSWLDRGSDERQFCAPGIDLPVCSVTKSKYGEYTEYHTSLDNLDFISPKGLAQSLGFYLKIFSFIEANRTPKIQTFGEPQLGKRNLYPNISIKNDNNVQNLVNVISFLDGQHNLFEISEICGIELDDTQKFISTLLSAKLIEF